VQTRIAAGIGAMHEEHVRPVADHDIRYELLVGGILFGGRPIEIRPALPHRGAQPGEIGTIGAAQPMEIHAVRDVGTRQNEDAFGHGGSLSADA
jgi:hypothetical protein